MGQYLSKFKGAIGQRQSSQILNLLNKRRNTGQIRSFSDFTKQLEGLMRELTSTTLQPTLKLFPPKANELISSEQYNFMIDRVYDDLEAAFEESNNIEAVQQAHEALIKDILLKSLRAGVAELESKISLYESLNRDTHGFDQAVFSTFRESKENRTHNVSLSVRNLFIDPRVPDTNTSLNDAAIDIVGERLTLGHDSISYHNISSVKQLFDSTTPQSELLVNPPGVSLQNIIDNTVGTYWIQALLFSSKKSSVKVKLELDFGTVREFNFIEIEPALVQDIILESIHYIDGNNITQQLTENEVTLTGPTSVHLVKTSAQKIILTFRDEHYSSIQFSYNDNDTLLNQAIQEPVTGTDGNVNLVNKELRDIVTSTEVRDIIGIGSVTEDSIFNGYEFVFGIDNIRLGLTQHASSSIYVSKPLSVSSVGEIGLRTVESRSYKDTNNITHFTSDTYADNNVFLNSIEYWIVKQDFNTGGTLTRTTKFPLLPLGVSRVYNERLLLTEKTDVSIADPDIGSPVFFTNTDTSEGNIIVYRNGVAIVENTDWENITTVANRTPNNGDPMKFRIKILDQLPGDVFTVSYNPLISSTRNIPTNVQAFSSIGGLQIVDLVGDMSAYADNNQLITINDSSALTSSESKLYLTIVLRQNTADISTTPTVEEYTLLVGTTDIERFKEV
jgi:hypothetical protein